MITVLVGSAREVMHACTIISAWLAGVQLCVRSRDHGGEGFWLCAASLAHGLACVLLCNQHTCTLQLSNACVTRLASRCSSARYGQHALCVSCQQTISAETPTVPIIQAQTKRRTPCQVPSEAPCAMQGVSEHAGAELGPLLLIDTAGADMEELGEASGSRSSAGEAGLALAHVCKLVAAGLKPQDIGIISPYSAQVS